YSFVDVGGFPIAEVELEKPSPGSLWNGANSRNRLFSDFRARDVGDIITVLIVDKTSASGEATTETGGTSSNDYNVNAIAGMPLDLGMTDFMGLGNRFDPNFSGGRSNSFSGTGTTERMGQITASLAVRVLQVLSNGNLYVEGGKETTVNSERQYVTISGIIRPEDVTAGNTITSDSISDLMVELSGDGVIAGKQNPGWLTSVLDKVWPF
ncbi:MAG: flagellar basal body L-ring protein FlgH, partial [Proteobacteria bacterium]|nr:flagellar basal body L-ring protein FlgH [Pseudomonadota bacterium]